MDITPEKDKFIDTPELDIVANAMMKTYWRFIQKRGMVRIEPPQKEIGEIFEQATSGMCFNASSEMARFLAEEHKDSFETIIIITTHDILENSPIRDEIDTGGFHSYILIKDKKGMWYATSPANHNMNIKSSDQKTNKDNGYATTLFCDPDLQTILAKIEDRDKCQFPNETEILENLTNARIPEIVDAKAMNILEIISRKNKITSKITMVESLNNIKINPVDFEIHPQNE